MLPYFNFGSFQVFTYPLILGIIWGLSYKLGIKFVETKNLPIKQFKIYFFGAFVSAWLGAKGLFLLTLDLSVVQRAVVSGHFWLGGGFVFYGGLIGGLIFTLIYSHKKRLSLSHFNFTIPILVFGHALGRIGCFLAGCCYGSVCELPWSVNLQGYLRHPVQLYESFFLFVLGYILLKRFLRDKPLIIFYLCNYSILRFFLEFFRGDEIRGLFGLISTSQIVSLFIIVCCVVFKRYYIAK
jgi:phosphatidylglycerol:prolipoprotein diacylglycerol transferase